MFFPSIGRSVEKQNSWFKGTDQGTEFLNRHFRALMKEDDVEHL